MTMRICPSGPMTNRPDYIIIDDNLNKHPYMDSWRLAKAIAKCQSNGKSLTFHSSGGHAAITRRREKQK